MSQTVFSVVSQVGLGPVRGRIDSGLQRYFRYGAAVPTGTNDLYHALLAMPELTEKTISCPYCGEAISVLIDSSFPDQHYVEDCQVCCRPIVLDVLTDAAGDVAVQARSEND